jgi:predicted O-methyltransferase YrrM
LPHEASQIEAIRKQCRNNNDTIVKTDYGNNSGSRQAFSYPVSIRKIAHYSLTPPRYARRLFHLAQFLKASHILEIGTSLGLTTAYLAIACPQAKIITLEGCPELCRIAKEHFNRLKIKNIEVIQGQFENTIPLALQKLGKIDLVYIDGNHRKSAMLDYYEKCVEHSDNNSIMVFDDIRGSIDTENAWEEIKQKKKVVVSLDFFFSGWVLFRKESSREHLNLRYV